MKALVYEGPGVKTWTDVPEPKIQNPGDVIVRVDTTTICGTDLHILKGDVPAVQKGRILGHEGVGTITEVGSSVVSLKPGDRVIISCIKSCGHCANCRTGLYSHCMGEEGQSGIGWIFGHLIDGTQAEFVRVPYAENSLHLLPEGVSDEQAVMLSDILPTGFEIGVQYGRVKPGDAVAVVGAGPVGLAAIATAGLYGAATVIAVDLDANRLEKAREFGATHTVLSGDADWKKQVLALTDGQGVDVAIEAVGIPATFTMCVDIVRPGGNVANRRAWQAGGTARGRSLDPEHQYQHGLGQRQHRTHAAQTRRPEQIADRKIRHAPLHLRPDHGRLRHLLQGSGDKGPEGGHHNILSTVKTAKLITMKALVLYDSTYGNTRSIAETVASSLRAHGPDAANQEGMWL